MILPLHADNDDDPRFQRAWTCGGCRSMQFMMMLENGWIECYGCGWVCRDKRWFDPTEVPQSA